MHDLAIFGTGFLLSLSLCLDIGVVNIALINTAIRDGARAAAFFAVGSCIGDLTYAVASLLGIGLLLQYEWVRLALYATGTAVLLAMSGMALRAGLREMPGTAFDGEPVGDALVARAAPDPRRMFLYGLGITLASPSAIIWFAAVGGSLIAQSGADTPSSLLALLGGFFLAGASWCVFVIGVAAYGGQALGPRFRQVCHLISAVLFLYFATRIIGALIAMLA
jgi:L-lysine exporter family protein LysE/ArgO